MQGIKKCEGCKQEIPLEDFEVTASGQTRSRCRDCHAARTEKAEEDKAKKKGPTICDPRMAAIEVDAVGNFCDMAKSGGNNIPHVAELVESLYARFGGVDGFGTLMAKQYFDSVPGGAHRTKILVSILQLTANNTAVGGAKKPLDLMTEEELTDELNRKIAIAAMSQHHQHRIGVVIDEQKQEE
jgi:hypothetical protein